MTELLRTERLVLRQFTPDDADLLLELDSDPEVMRYINGGTPTPANEIRDVMIPRWLDWYAKPGGYGYWAALELPAMTFVGWFHLRPDEHDPEQCVDLGYRLRRDAWGRGLATEGSRALIDYGFSSLGLQRISAHAMIGNDASMRVMEKAGMRREREFLHPLCVQCVRYVVDAPGSSSETG